MSSSYSRLHGVGVEMESGAGVFGVPIFTLSLASAVGFGLMAMIAKRGGLELPAGVERYRHIGEVTCQRAHL